MGTPGSTPAAPRRRVAFAPGRVNLIGDHTDYAAGLALPIAVPLGTTVDVVLGGDTVVLRSDADPDPASVPMAAAATFGGAGWARYVAGVVSTCRPPCGAIGEVHTTLPLGAGLSSSAALEVAVALALGGAAADPLELALACQRAEHIAVGVPCGVMDQLASINGRAGHALLMDFALLSVEPVPMPPDVVVWVVDSGAPRQLADTPYAQRRDEVEGAIRAVGPLRQVSVDDLGSITDADVRRRARHVITENARVLAVCEAFADGDSATAGAVMSESQRSLRDDMEVSTPVLDELVDQLERTPGVLGARVTGAGFGGCIVALAERGTRIDRPRAWEMTPADGARVLFED